MTRHASGEVADSISDAVSIDPLDLDTEFTKLPSLLARFNELFADALRSHLTAKYNRDRTWARRFIELRGELAERGEKVTEAGLKAHVEVDEEYQRAVRAAVLAEAEKTRLWGRVDALRAKRDALISLGAHMRAEMTTNPSMRGEHRGARDVERNNDGQDDEDFAVEIG